MPQLTPPESLIEAAKEFIIELVRYADGTRTHCSNHPDLPDLDVRYLMTNLGKITLYHVVKHFVVLSCMVRKSHDSPDDPCVFSGFVVEIEGIWLYITAGHVLRRIREATDAGYAFSTWRFREGRLDPALRHSGIPYDFRLEEWLVIENDDTGLDYAAVGIYGLTRANLEVGGVVPVKEHTWGEYTAEHDYWALVGAPAERVSHDGRSTLSLSLTLIPLEESAPPEPDTAKSDNRFYARIPANAECTVENIDGMSGGPIFALKRLENEIRYKAIGIQSGWFRPDRILFACPFSTFANELAREFASIASQDSH